MSEHLPSFRTEEETRAVARALGYDGDAGPRRTNTFRVDPTTGEPVGPTADDTDMTENNADTDPDDAPLFKNPENREAAREAAEDAGIPLDGDDDLATLLAGRAAGWSHSECSHPETACPCVLDRLAERHGAPDGADVPESIAADLADVAADLGALAETEDDGSGPASGERPVSNASSRYTTDGGQPRHNAYPTPGRGGSGGTDLDQRESTGPRTTGESQIRAMQPKGHVSRAVYDAAKAEYPGENFTFSRWRQWKKQTEGRDPLASMIDADATRPSERSPVDGGEGPERENAGASRANYAGIPGPKSRSPDRSNASDGSDPSDYPMPGRRVRGSRRRHNAEDADDGSDDAEPDAPPTPGRDFGRSRTRRENALPDREDDPRTIVSTSDRRPGDLWEPSEEQRRRLRD